MKILLTLAIATVAGALTFGAAAALDFNAPGIGSGSQEITNCEGEGGLGVDYVLNESNPTLVEGVTISNISDECSGGTAYLLLTGAEGEPVLPDGAIEAVIGDSATSVVVAVTPEVAASAIDGVELTIVGPGGSE